MPYTSGMTDEFPMTSHRPYLLRALYEWIADNDLTPHLLVHTTRPHVQVPNHAVKDGRIVLNVAQRAVVALEMTNDTISFSARFGGVSHNVSVPVSAVLAIYARENGQGMAQAEALSALANLGYAPGEAVQAVAQAAESHPQAGTPELIRASLRLLAPKE